MFVTTLLSLCTVDFVCQRYAMQIPLEMKQISKMFYRQVASVSGLPVYSLAFVLSSFFFLFPVRRGCICVVCAGLCTQNPPGSDVQLCSGRTPFVTQPSRNRRRRIHVPTFGSSDPFLDSARLGILARIPFYRRRKYFFN